MIDKVDRKILNVLREDSRLSFRHIAKRVGVSVVTVINRMERMRKGGVIKRYSTIIDYDKLGFDVPVIIEINTRQGKAQHVMDMLVKEPSVLAIYDVTGDVEVEILAKFKNRTALNNFIKRIQTYPEILRTHTRLILTIVKEEACGIKF